MRLIPRYKHLFRPSYYLGKRTIRRTKRMVRQGPFKGMRYIRRSYGSVYFPKLLGIYEREIYPYLDRVIPRGHDVMVDIGVAEGYFAVGLAMRQPAPVVGFESNPDAARAANDMAELNGVRDRVEIKGLCTPSILQSTLEPAASPFLMCDVDGYETELLSAISVPALKKTTMLVEIHEFARPGVTAELFRRFGGTHAMEVVWQTPRSADDYPFRDGWVERIPVRWLRSQVEELRPHEQSWLWLEPLDSLAKAA